MAKSKLIKIKDIIKSHHRFLLISLVGKDAVTEKEFLEIKKKFPSLVPRDVVKEVYSFNYGQKRDAQSVQQLPEKNISRPEIPSNKVSKESVETLTENLKDLLDKQKSSATERFISILEEENTHQKYKEISDVLVDDNMWEKERVRKIKEATGVLNRDWERIVATEMSSNIGTASIDFILKDNEGKDLKDVYIYRPHPDDDKVCRPCRKFYFGRGGLPKLYKLSTIVKNGSNWGKKRENWNPTVGATHPNARDANWIELKPGFILTDEGTDMLKEVGKERDKKWAEYIKENLEA